MQYSQVAPRTFWRNYCSSVVRNFRNQPPDAWFVEAGPKGLRVQLDSFRGWRGRLETWQVEWDEIISVEAFKTDNLTYDTIWVSLSTKDGEAIVFCDEAPGWEAVAAALPTHLPGCLAFEEWFRDVAVPAFAPNPKRLFERSAV